MTTPTMTPRLAARLLLVDICTDDSYTLAKDLLLHNLYALDAHDEDTGRIGHRMLTGMADMLHDAAEYRNESNDMVDRALRNALIALVEEGTVCVGYSVRNEVEEVVFIAQ